MNLESALFHLCPLQPGCPYCAEHATTSPESRLDWSFLDGIDCISLQSRGDQATTVVRELHRVGLCRQTFFYRPGKHPTSPTRGVWESHRVAFYGGDRCQRCVRKQWEAIPEEYKQTTVFYTDQTIT